MDLQRSPQCVFANRRHVNLAACDSRTASWRLIDLDKYSFAGELIRDFVCEA